MQTFFSFFFSLGNFANFCLWARCICCGFDLLQWVELLSRRDRVNVPQNQHAKPFGACVAKWVTTQKVCFLLYLGWRQLPFPCVCETGLPWGLTKSCGKFLLPAGQLRANKPHLIFIRQVIIINWVTHNHKTTTEQSCGLWMSPLALRHSDSHTSLNLNHPKMRIGFPIQEWNKPTVAALW